jgi:hypothetical protein
VAHGYHCNSLSRCYVTPAGTVKKRITSGVYDTDGALFVSDMRLIWENCVTYNDPASDIAAFAASLGEAFEAQLGAVLEELSAEAEAAAEAAAAAASASAAKSKPKKVKDEPAEEEVEIESSKKVRKPKPSAADGAEEGEGGAEVKKPVSANMKKMKKIVKAMYADDRSLPFREPVPVDEVPGYAELIARPMDLSTVKANLVSYEDSPGKFLRDMRLIFDNCQKFNMEDSDIYKNAGALRDMVDQLYTEHFPPVDHAAEAAMKIKVSAKARKASVVDEDGEETPGAAASAATTLKLPKAIAKEVAASSAGATASAGARDAESSASSMAINLPTPKVSARMQSLPTKLEDLNALAAELSNPNTDAAQNSFVRERAFHRAHEKLRATRLPFVVAPELYVVRKFGDLYPDYKCHNADYIYPIGYACLRTLRICLVPEGEPSGEEAGAAKSWVSVELKSLVVVGEEDIDGSQRQAIRGGVEEAMDTVPATVGWNQLPGKGALALSTSHRVSATKFQVTLENGTVLSEATSPLTAWQQLRGRELQVLSVLGSKLKRCRAVFNRLAVSPDALPFLDMVPLTGPVGQSYYSIITAPMWFREVHSRLVEGTYDVEFDFAWDMRLIFKNCMEYNLKGSELYESAVRLGDCFEHLFAQWVLNVQDRSIDDLAKGPWDAWLSLRYFDFADPTVNVCSLTGSRAPASQMLQCRCCEDQILASMHAPVQHKSQWVCSRCQEALDMAGGDLTGNPFAGVKTSSQAAEAYSCEEFGGNVYVPAPEFGVGWNQAKRRGFRAGLKNTFLSPLGYEVPSREDILNQVVYEDVVNQNLYAARAAEFQEFSKTNRPRSEAKKTARHRRGASTVADPLSPEKQEDAKPSTTSAPAIDPLAADEVGRIPTGKLSNYQVPEGHRLAWFGCSDEAAALQRAAGGHDISALLSDRAELDFDALPPTGFFGFEIPAIRARIEGLEGSMTCTGYAYLETIKHRDAILEDVLSAKRRLELLSVSEEALRKVLLDERWRYDKQLLIPPHPDTPLPAASMDHKPGFAALFPQTFTVEQCDTVLALWELMFYCPSLNKTVDAYSLHDLVSALTPPPTILPTYGQVVFDEVCCNLTTVLLNEVRCRADVKDEAAWQDALMVRPLNVITWPEVALEALRLIVFPLSSREVRNLLDVRRVPAHIVKQRDILCLLLNHPVIDTFLVQVPPPTEGFTNGDPNKVILSLRALKDHFSSVDAMLAYAQDTTSSYSTLETFCAALRDMFVEMLSIPDLAAVRVLHAHCLIEYLTGLFKRWNVSVLDVEGLEAPSKEHMSAQLNSETQAAWRFWGGYVLSNLDVPQGQVVTPSTFRAGEVSDYQRRIGAHNALEKTFALLARSEPEAWTAADRAAVFATFIDLCVVAREFVASTHHRQTLVNNKIGHYIEAPNAGPEHPPQIQIVTHTPPGARCHFTGIEVDHTMERVQWVAVPYAYQGVGGAPPPKPAAAESLASTGRGMRSVNNTYTGPVALHGALMKVIMAREAALAEARKHEVSFTCSDELLYSLLTCVAVRTGLPGTSGEHAAAQSVRGSQV